MLGEDRGGLKGKRWEVWVVVGNQTMERGAWAQGKVVADGFVQDDCRAGRVTVTTGACSDRQPDCENSGHARVSTKLKTNRLNSPAKVPSSSLLYYYHLSMHLENTHLPVQKYI